MGYFQKNKNFFFYLIIFLNFNVVKHIYFGKHFFFSKKSAFLGGKRKTSFFKNNYLKTIFFIVVKVFLKTCSFEEKKLKHVIFEKTKKTLFLKTSLKAFWESVFENTLEKHFWKKKFKGFGLPLLKNRFFFFFFLMKTVLENRFFF